MQNEFEKQVQKKMDELKLVPSDPVWQKVEMQIRQKKDRRRIFFWLPIALLLTGGGIWFAVNSDSKMFSDNRRSRNETGAPVVTSKEITNNTIDRKTPGRQKNTIDQKEEATKETTLIDRQQIATETDTYLKLQEIYKSQKKINRNEKTIAHHPVSKKESFISRDQTFSGDLEKTVITNEKADRISEQEPTLSQINKSELERPSEKNADSIIASTNEDERSDTTFNTLDSLVRRDTAALNKLALQKPKQNKWAFVVTGNGGLSGEGRISVFNGMKSLDSGPYYSAPNNSQNPGPNAPVLYGESPVTRGFSFSIGGVAKRQWGERTFFYTGVECKYYSNSIVVGYRVTQSAVIRDYAVSSYYSNNFFGNAASTSYHNKYHFVAVPLALEWQLARELPLNLHAALTPQYLVQTNALVFDYNRQAYFHNKKAFNRLQLFSDFGLSYRIPLKRNSVTIGPELQYGLSRLEKDNPTRHLFSYGLKAQLQFNRK